MMKNYSNNLHIMKIVRFACYPCHHYIRGIDINPAAERLYAVDALLRYKEEIVLVYVHFAEFQLLVVTKRMLKGLSTV